jgi:hypothetical protein
MPSWKHYWGILNGNTGKPQGPLIEAGASSGGARDPKKSIIKRIGLAFANGSGSRGTLEGPVGFDLSEVEKAYNTEAYVRQAIDKYVDFIFKAGWDIVGKNQSSVDYIKTRLAAIAESTKIPTKQLLIEIAEDMVLYHNCFLIKARQSGSYQYPPGITATGISGGKPVVGYFPLPVTTITIARDQQGTIQEYQQQVSGAQPLKLKPDDVIHMYVDKPKGRAFGVPFVWQALDDIKLLRQVEELIARLIYKDIFPLYQYQVGLAQSGYEATDDEIALVQEQISNLTLDGGIVVPERHNISVIGSNGKALDAYEYLKYFEARVFTGLGVSETMMGRGDTANRGTADNMTTEMHDRIKAYQSNIAMFVDEYIVYELLREGGFDPLLRPDDAVHFQFKEIDLDNKIKLENQAIQKFTQNAITHEELRMEIGMDPVTDEGRLYFNMITIPVAEAGKAAVESTNAANNAGSNKAQPANQNGKKLSPKKSTQSVSESLEDSGGLRCQSYGHDLQHYWEIAKEDILDLAKQFYLNREKNYPNDPPKQIEGTLKLARDSMTNIADKYIRLAFQNGVEDVARQNKTQRKVDINYLAGVKELSDKNARYVEKLTNDVSRLITNALVSQEQVDALSKIVGAFDALSYRLDFIAKSEIYGAYNFGFAKAAMSLGYTSLTVSQGDVGCDTCKSLAGTQITLTSDLSNLPPFHTNCTCTVQLNLI